MGQSKRSFILKYRGISVEYLYQEHRRYFAQIAHPVEALGAAELTEFGATDVEPGYRGVYFRADAGVLYDIVYGARIPTRVLAPLMTFDCHSDNYLYKRAMEMDWSSLIGIDRSFAVFASVAHSRIQHSKYASLKLKDAIVDKIRNDCGSRPSVDRHNPDVSLNLHIQNNRATINLDAAGRSMHRRGYRLDAVEAPIQETVAALMLRMAEWSGERPLLDPMCGSGTILAEALMLATRTPAGFLHKHFGFEEFPDFDRALWKMRQQVATDAIRPVEPGLISGSDIDGEAVGFARQNLDRLPHGGSVRLQQRDYREIESFQDGCIVSNPPYGMRIGNRNSIGEFYGGLGDFLKQRCTNSTAFIYVGKPELLKKVGLRTTWKKELMNGALDGRFAKYEMY